MFRSFGLYTLTGLCCMTLVSNARAQEAPTIADPVGYFLGLSVGQSFAQQGFTDQDFQTESLMMGLKDALAGKDSALSGEQLGEAQGKIEAMLRKRQMEAAAEMKKMGVANKEKADAWFSENAKVDGIKQIQGGLQYKVITQGEGSSPSASDTVSVHYTGKFLNGEVFDSSVERGQPAKFQVGQVIKGWQMALKEMKVGSKWMLYIPPSLGYGENGAPPKIGPNEILVFEVELLEIL